MEIQKQLEEQLLLQEFQHKKVFFIPLIQLT